MDERWLAELASRDETNAHPKSLKREREDEEEGELYESDRDEEKPLAESTSTNAPKATGGSRKQRIKRRKIAQRERKKTVDYQKGENLQNRHRRVHHLGRAAILEHRYIPRSTAGFPQTKMEMPLTVSDLMQAGYRIEYWDGSTNKCFQDPATQSIYAACVGGLVHDAFDKTCAEAHEKLQEYGNQLRASKNTADCKIEPEAEAGSKTLPLIHVGVTLDRQTQEPTNVDLGDENERIYALVEDPVFRRLAHYADSSLSLFSPRQYAYHHAKSTLLFQKSPQLKQNFPRSLYTATALDLGPTVSPVTYPNQSPLQGKNAFGWCAIQALGNFDARKGGHIVFPSLKLAVEFPSGGLVLVPSTLAFGIVGIQNGETRSSLVHYTDGGLIGFVEKRFAGEDCVRRDGSGWGERGERVNESCIVDGADDAADLWSDLAVLLRD